MELGFDLGGAVALAVRDLARVQKLLAHFTRCEKVMSVLSRGDHWAAGDLPEIYAILLDDAVVTGPRGGKSVRTAQHLPALKKLRNCVTEHLGLDGAHAARMRHDASAAQKFEQKCRLRLNTVSTRYLEEHTSMSALAKHAHGILVAALAELERVIAVECARMDTGLLESALRATLESAEATLSWREVLITKKRKAKGQKHAPPPVRTEKEHKLSCGAMLTTLRETCAELDEALGLDEEAADTRLQAKWMHWAGDATPYTGAMAEAITRVTHQHVGRAFYTHALAGNLHLFLRTAVPTLTCYGLLTLMCTSKKSVAVEAAKKAKVATRYNDGGRGGGMGMGFRAVAQKGPTLKTLGWAGHHLAEPLRAVDKAYPLLVEANFKLPILLKHVYCEHDILGMYGVTRPVMAEHVYDFCAAARLASFTLFDELVLRKPSFGQFTLEQIKAFEQGERTDLATEEGIEAFMETIARHYRHVFRGGNPLTTLMTDAWARIINEARQKLGFNPRIAVLKAQHELKEEERRELLDEGISIATKLGLAYRWEKACVVAERSCVFLSREAGAEERHAARRDLNDVCGLKTAAQIADPLRNDPADHWNPYPHRKDPYPNKKLERGSDAEALTLLVRALRDAALAEKRAVGREMGGMEDAPELKRMLRVLTLLQRVIEDPEGATMLGLKLSKFKARGEQQGGQAAATPPASTAGVATVVATVVEATTDDVGGREPATVAHAEEGQEDLDLDEGGIKLVQQPWATVESSPLRAARRVQALEGPEREATAQGMLDQPTAPAVPVSWAWTYQPNLPVPSSAGQWRKTAVFFLRDGVASVGILKLPRPLPTMENHDGNAEVLVYDLEEDVKQRPASTRARGVGRVQTKGIFHEQVKLRRRGGDEAEPEVVRASAIAFTCRVLMSAGEDEAYQIEPPLHKTKRQVLAEAEHRCADVLSATAAPVPAEASVHAGVPAAAPRTSEPATDMAVEAEIETEGSSSSESSSSDHESDDD